MVNYEIKGYLVISQCYSTDCYIDAVTVVKDNFIGRQVKRFYDWLLSNQEAVIRRDAKRYNVAEGERIPKWTLSHLHFQPFRFANRFFKRVSPHYLSNA